MLEAIERRRVRGSPSPRAGVRGRRGGPDEPPPPQRAVSSSAFRRSATRGGGCDRAPWTPRRLRPPRAGRPGSHGSASGSRAVDVRARAPSRREHLHRRGDRSGTASRTRRRRSRTRPPPQIEDLVVSSAASPESSKRPTWPMASFSSTTCGAEIALAELPVERVRDSCVLELLAGRRLEAAARRLRSGSPMRVASSSRRSSRSYAPKDRPRLQVARPTAASTSGLARPLATRHFIRTLLSSRASRRSSNSGRAPCRGQLVERAHDRGQRGGSGAARPGLTADSKNFCMSGRGRAATASVPA